ncbi:MAG: hypothetical protein M3169_07410 [Candidatus Eremiobacteraeota bacterium]|nr:hypothetical protein [Candidatus Eremiobacteraeota bacterium]
MKKRAVETARPSGEAPTSWWERAVRGGAEWHYVRLSVRTGERVARFARCGCGRYRVEQLVVSPLTANRALTDAPADPACYAKVTDDPDPSPR